jgi:hypothetical protein
MLTTNSYVLSSVRKKNLRYPKFTDIKIVKVNFNVAKQLNNTKP